MNSLQTQNLQTFMDVKFIDTNQMQGQYHKTA